MQTTGSLRPNYQYYHAYGGLDECHQVSSPQHNGLEIDRAGDQVLLLHHHHHHHHPQQQQHHHPQPHHQPAIPNLMQLSGSGDAGGANCYEDPSRLQHQQPPMIIYNSDRPEVEAYNQANIETRLSTTSNEADNFDLLNFPIEYQAQPQDQPLGEGVIYYEPTGTLSYGAGSDGLRAPLEGRAHDQAIYCVSTGAISEPNNATSCHLEPQQAYYHHHQHHPYTTDDQQIDHKAAPANESTCPGDCVAPELTDSQRVYQSLDEVPQKQPIGLGNLTLTNSQLIELTTTEPETTIEAQKSHDYDYSCYASQLQPVINRHHESNHERHCLVDGPFDDARRDLHSPAGSSISDSSSEDSTNSTLTRDEKRAREANLPMSYHEIVNLSIDQFNQHLAKHSLTETQLQLIKDIRRRGKNKVAAQSCRKRKMEQIYKLQHEVNSLATRRVALEHECDQLIREYERLVHHYNKINSILQHRLQQHQFAADCNDQNHLQSIRDC